MIGSQAVMSANVDDVFNNEENLQQNILNEGGNVTEDRMETIPKSKLKLKVYKYLTLSRH